MNLRDWESRRTRAAWGTGSGSPVFMMLACLTINTIALIVTIVINSTINDDGYNDYGPGMAWSFHTPAPALGFLWALIDLAVCHYSVVNPVYYLSESAILFVINAVFGSMGISMYSWDSEGSWAPGIPICVAALVYAAIMAISARVVHHTRKRPQSSGMA